MSPFLLGHPQLPFLLEEQAEKKTAVAINNKMVNSLVFDIASFF
jgi:hypothetical protein